MSVDSNYTVTTKNFVNEGFQGKGTETMTIFNPFTNVKHEASVLIGTHNLKERVDTLGTYKNELSKAESCGNRALRIAGLLITAGSVAAVVAGAVIGNFHLIFWPSIALGFIGIAKYCFEDRQHHPLEVFVYPLTGLLRFVYDNVTAESQAKEKVTQKEAEIAEIKKYLSENRNKIEVWINEKRNEIIDEIEKQSKVIFKLNLAKIGWSLNKLEKALAEVRKANNTLDVLESYNSSTTSRLT